MDNTHSNSLSMSLSQESSSIISDNNVLAQNNINEYPEELFLKIFSFLDLASLKNLTLVNKR